MRCINSSQLNKDIAFLREHFNGLSMQDPPVYPSLQGSVNAEMEGDWEEEVR